MTMGELRAAYEEHKAEIDEEDVFMSVYFYLGAPAEHVKGIIK